MAYEWAKPGVKCVCINDEWLPGLGGKDEFLVSGQIYTISLVKANFELCLEGFEPSRYASRFRPLIERNQSQDMEEHFNHLLSIDLGVTLDILDKHVMEE